MGAAAIIGKCVPLSHPPYIRLFFRAIIIFINGEEGGGEK
jgi:hypothetical protein